MDAYEKVEIARNPKRKTSLEYIEKIFDEFIELHGDRQFKDDKAIVCGLARIGNQNFTIIAEQKGRTTKENIRSYKRRLAQLRFSIRWLGFSVGRENRDAEHCNIFLGQA